jgi:hypothetical protein
VGLSLSINMRSDVYSIGSTKNGGETRVLESAVQDGDFAQAGTYVEAKYMGTLADQREMSMLGRTQVLRVRNPHNGPCGHHLMTMCRGTFSLYPSWVSVAHLLAPGNSF